MEEIWKDIPGYEGYYQVSNKGRVRCLERYVSRNDGRHGLVIQRVDPRIIRPLTLKTGYKSVMLHKEGKTKRTTIHRLVALAFIPNPHNKRTVNHKDGVRTNNNVENLEWCTQSENILHASRVLHTLTFHGKPVRCIETGEEFRSAKEAARKYGLADTNLSSAIRGVKQQTFAGYHWEYINS